MNILKEFSNELGYINVTNQYIELAVRCYERECGDEPIESIARSVNLSISTLPEDYYARVSKGYHLRNCVVIQQKISKSTIPKSRIQIDYNGY